MQRTVEGHHEIADTLLLQAHPIFDDAAALDTTVDMLDPQPRWWMELLVSYVLLPHERLPQIVINSFVDRRVMNHRFPGGVLRKGAFGDSDVPPVTPL